MDPVQSPQRFGGLHYAVALGGLAVLLMLTFASKTALSNDTPQPMGGRAGKTPTPPENGGQQGEKEERFMELFGLIPQVKKEGAHGPILDSLEAAGENRELRLRLLRQLVGTLRDNGRPDAAAVYAGELARQDQTVKNLVVAGALFRISAQEPPIAKDSVAFSRWMDESLMLLESAVELDSTNEDAHIELGLAYVQSQRGENSMKGIMELKKVLDLNPGNQEASYQLGIMSMTTGQWEKAEGRFRAIKADFPKYLECRLMLGSALLEQGKKPEATQILNELASQKKNPEIAAQAKKILSTH